MKLNAEEIMELRRVATCAAEIRWGKCETPLPISWVREEAEKAATLEEAKLALVSRAAPRA